MPLRHILSNNIKPLACRGLALFDKNGRNFNVMLYIFLHNLALGIVKVKR